MPKQKVAIIGGGAAGIMCACHLDTSVYDVHLYEKTSRLGRKLLVAGEGGFNLTYHEVPEVMAERYSDPEFVLPFLTAFSSKDLRKWLSQLGVETFVGTSGKVFPVKGIKPYMVVNKLQETLDSSGVVVHTIHQWLGWENGSLLFDNDGEKREIKADVVILALGGGSWVKTGSDGQWMRLLQDKGITCSELEASNCRWIVRWHPEIVRLCSGRPLKNIVVTVNGISHRGEAMISADGLEGGVIYAHAANIRNAISKQGKASIQIDLKPDLQQSVIAQRLAKRKKSIKHCLVNELRLSIEAFRILRYSVGKDVYNDPYQLAAHVKCCEVITQNHAGIDSAISSAGGLKLTEIDANLQVKKLPNHYAIGEMLDWDTRTGGYLLQLCFSTAVAVAKRLNVRSLSAD